MSLCIAIIGGDRRQFYMMEYLLCCRQFPKLQFQTYHPDFPKGHLNLLKKLYPGQIHSCDSMDEALLNTSACVLPVPFKQKEPSFFASAPLPPLILGGAFTPKLFDEEKHLVVDLMQNKAFVHKNALLTAEGLLKYMIESSPLSLCHSNILICGYGNCGSIIAKNLAALHAHVSIYDHAQAACAQAEADGFSYYSILQENNTPANFDFVVNTVPQPIFKASFLRKLPAHCRLFDIAGGAGGFDTDICQGLSLHVMRCPGIPGKTAPYTSGRSIAHILSSYLKNIASIERRFS